MGVSSLPTNERECWPYLPFLHLQVRKEQSLPPRPLLAWKAWVAGLSTHWLLYRWQLPLLCNVPQALCFLLWVAPPCFREGKVLLICSLCSIPCPHLFLVEGGENFCRIWGSRDWWSLLLSSNLCPDLPHYTVNYYIVTIKIFYVFPPGHHLMIPRTNVINKK